MVRILQILNTLALCGILALLCYTSITLLAHLKDYHHAMVIIELEKMEMLAQIECPTDFYDFGEKEESL